MNISAILASDLMHYDWLPWWLCRMAPDLSPTRIVDLDQRFGLANFLRDLPRYSSSCRLTKRCCTALCQPDWPALQQQLAWVQQPGQALIHYNSPLYPPVLRHTQAPPPLLWVCGNVAVLQWPAVAMVGSRRPSFLAKQRAYEWAMEVSSQWVVVSGLAQGIDTAAHEGALSGSGQTIAVLGSAVDRIYPASNFTLAKRIVAQGAVVSQWPLGVGPRRHHFPQRNAVISGLSLGVVVMEAGLRSGSLITAHCAAEQGREVMVVPGEPANPLSQGGNALIKQGAGLVCQVDDIYEQLMPFVDGNVVKKEAGVFTESKTTLAPGALLLLECVDFVPTTVAQLVARSGRPVAWVMAQIMLLEAKKSVQRTPTGFVRRA
jgi:DNA processing protein